MKLIISWTNSEGEMIVQGSFSPKLIMTELVDPIMAAQGWEIVEDNFDHAASKWSFKFRPAPIRPAISGPDNEFGLPASDLI